jgi:hypothetical protein
MAKEKYGDLQESTKRHMGILGVRWCIFNVYVDCIFSRVLTSMSHQQQFFLFFKRINGTYGRRRKMRPALRLFVFIIHEYKTNLPSLNNNERSMHSSHKYWKWMENNSPLWDPGIRARQIQTFVWHKPNLELESLTVRESVTQQWLYDSKIIQQALNRAKKQITSRGH